MKIKDALYEGNKILLYNNIEDSKLKLRMLLSHILNVKKEYLLIYDMQELDINLEKDFFEKVKRLSKNEPIQYIINSVEFMGINFYVDKNVLIPQPDTEILVQKTIEAFQSRKNIQKILDLCTGSGAIGVSLCKNLNNVQIVATDISENALNIAKKNAEKNKAKIKFVKSDLFENINEEFDIIVSNPPYIETDVINTLSEEVRYEPILALDGGKDGLDFYRIIANNSRKYLKENGMLLLEVGYNQKKSVMNILKKSGFKNIECYKDLSNYDRVIMAEKE